jgi:hypothetical protein
VSRPAAMQFHALNIIPGKHTAYHFVGNTFGQRSKMSNPDYLIFHRRERIPLFPIMMIPLWFPKTRVLIRAPTQSQFNAIEASLTRQEQEIVGLDFKITNLKNRIAVLANERRLLNEAIETKQSKRSNRNP